MYFICRKSNTQCTQHLFHCKTFMMHPNHQMFQVAIKIVLIVANMNPLLHVFQTILSVRCFVLHYKHRNLLVTLKLTAKVNPVFGLVIG